MKKKTIKVWYWIVTILFVAFMLFSGISELVGTEAGNQLLISLGYPLYLNWILGIAKVLGAIVLVIPGLRVLKEWAYAGFAIDLIGATLSFMFSGYGFVDSIFPLIFLAVMFVSYWLWKKKDK